VGIEHCFTCTSENERELVATLQSPSTVWLSCMKRGMRFDDHTYAVGGRGRRAKGAGGGGGRNKGERKEEKGGEEGGGVEEGERRGKGGERRNEK